MTQQKLYTEEQVRLLLNNTSLEYISPFNLSLPKSQQVAPIELPSDEEIESGMNERLFLSDKHLQFNAGTKAGFKLGAKWMKEQILNQSK